MGKFKVGDRIIQPGWHERDTCTVVSISETRMTVRDDRGCTGSYTHLAPFVLVKPAITIEPGKHYRLRNGKVTGRVSTGDIGFEALVDGQVKVFDKAGGAVFGGEDIVEAWVPKVGERVKYKVERYGEGTVVELVDEKHVKVDTHGPFKICTEHVSDLEPLLVAAPAQPAVLKIEAGKFYRTRDGRKVGPIGENVGGLPGCPWQDDSNWTYCWQDDGSYYSDGEESQHDLIAEWVDEPVAVAASNDNGIISGLIGKSFTAKVVKPKFKVGDVVELTTDGYAARIGATARVVGVRDDGMFNIEWVRNSLHRGQIDGGYYLSPFKLAKAPTAIVALIENGQPKPSERPHVHATEAAAGKEAARLAGIHKGKQFGVYVLSSTAKEEVTYQHEWQRLAAKGEKINAIKELRSIASLDLLTAKQAVERFVDKAA